ncbi:MAG: hypothetical protein VB031_09510 [Eubacteriaceae bacterium]|nr:hypothetical protein [Eubacteriaceae bacterium]
MLFGNKFKKAIAQYKKGQSDAQDFVDTAIKMKVYYSTPIGDDENGDQQLYMLENSQTEVCYYPAFQTEKRCVDFFNEWGRTGFMVIEGDLTGLLSSFDSLPIIECGAIIDPGSNDEIIIPPHIRAAK